MREESLVLDKINIKESLYLGVKRLFDILTSSILLIVLSPLFFIISIIIKAQSKGKAIFTQDRIGEEGLTFKFYKFRTMVNDADKILDELLANDKEMALEYKLNKKLKNDPRVTKVGKFLRKTSLDELPQLINVFLGDMSLIGNRPYLPREINDMEEYYEDIIASKPGITGYWQVSGRNNNTFKRRCQMEASYSKNKSFMLDMKIFFKTFKVLLKGL